MTDTIQDTADFTLGQLGLFTPGVALLILFCLTVIGGLIWLYISAKREGVAVKEELVAELKQEREFSRKKTDMISQHTVEHLEMSNAMSNAMDRLADSTEVMSRDLVEVKARLEATGR